MELPQAVLIGPDAILDLGHELSRLGTTRVVIVTSKTPWRLFGDNLIEVLKNSGISHDVYLINKERGIRDESEEISAKIGTNGCDCLLGFGGGRVIDTAKLAASSMNLLFASVPTTPSHDGVASPLVSIPDADKRYSIYAKTPAVIIADIRILASSPHRYIASGFGDVIAKYTAVKDWKLAHLLKGEYYGDYAAKLAETSVEMVIREADKIGQHKEDGIRVLAEALINCGIVISIVGNSRPCSGSEHLFSHSLDLIANNPALHGEQVGVGTIMMAFLHDADWKLIRNTLKTVGSPITSEGLDTTPPKIVEALTMSHKIRPDRYTILGESGLTKEAAKSLSEETGVI